MPEAKIWSLTLPIANKRELPGLNLSCHCSVAPLPSMVIFEKMIGVAVGPKILLAVSVPEMVERKESTRGSTIVSPSPVPAMHPVV